MRDTLNVGLVTIGQSPRDDVLPSMFPHADRAAICQTGALDNLSAEHIEGLALRAGEHPLVTRLRSGNEVVIAKERVTPLMQQAVADLEHAGAALICVLCTGEFQLTSSSARLVYPDRLLKGVVDGLLDVGMLGVVIPHAGQAEWMQSKWGSDRRQVQLEVYSPYHQGTSIEPVAERLAAAGSDLIVLDCMGYTVNLQNAVLQVTGLPVVLASRLVGSVLTSMLPAR